MPRVAFILPARNAAATLPAALASVLGQTERDFELLAYDDGSTDDTREILEHAARGDPRVRIIGSERVGLVAALERAIAATSAELLARMDADDVCHPERLAEQLRLLDGLPELAAVGSVVRCFPSGAIAAGMRRYEQWLNSLISPEEIARDIFVESPLCHPSVTMRRSMYEQVGGYLDDGLPEDYHLWLRLHDRGHAMAKVPRVLLDWRERAGRLTRTDSRYAPARFLELKLRYLLSGPLRRRSQLTIWGAGRTGRTWGRHLAAAGLEVRAFVDVDPRKIGRRIRGAPVIAPAELERGIPGGFLLAAVGADGARPLIRQFLHERKHVEPVSFICVA